MSPRNRTRLLLLAFLVPGVLLAGLQNDTTNRVPPASLILRGYATGNIPRGLLATASPLIINARCLMRGLLWAGGHVSGLRVGVVNLVLQTVFVWAALCLVYAAAATLLSAGEACAAVLLTVAFVPWGFLMVGSSVSWPYDLPAIFFAAAGLWAILTRRFLVLAAVVVLGTLNKETVVFLVPAYLLAERPHLPRRDLWLRGVALAGLFAVAYEAPRLWLQASHSPVVTFSADDGEKARWFGNLAHLLFSHAGDLGENFYWPMTLHLAPLLGWRFLPHPLRAAYVAAAVVFFVPIFLFGNIHELRLYNELIPLGALGAVAVWSGSGTRPALPRTPDGLSTEHAASPTRA